MESSPVNQGGETSQKSLGIESSISKSLAMEIVENSSHEVPVTYEGGNTINCQHKGQVNETIQEGEIIRVEVVNIEERDNEMQIVEDSGPTPKVDGEVVYQTEEGTSKKSKGWKRLGARAKSHSLGAENLKGTSGIPILKSNVSTDVVYVWELMDNNGWGWNTDLLQRLFYEKDYRAILKIKSINPTRPDRWAWDSDAKGDYQVAKAYSKFVESKFRTLDIPEGSGSIKSRKTRLRSWRLNIKSKIKHFVWRSCTNTLPVSLNLKRRGMEVDWICHRCGEEAESAEHLFFNCEIAKQVWKLAPITWDFSSETTTSFKVWWENVCSTNNKDISEDRIQLTTYILWWLWKARNLWVFRKEWMPAHIIVSSALADWKEFLAKSRC
ncbi:Unknown protein [Striga hermonthica]|uniref:Reverse transcriptase zinc-binding domain-containing protein n=1 Tax=Striga hermonthica TaxID=68872 RepID=A0A9N7RRB0_STRHE|nr:Unknown protein [Striga hermonthica]